MFDLSPTGQLIVLIAVAYFAFMVGRATGGRRESDETRSMRQMQQEQDAADAFAALSPSIQNDVDRLLADKKLIEAVKLIREHTGKDLKDSKDIADMRRKRLLI